jgi:hypothetical protein
MAPPADPEVPLSANNMDTPEHRTLYAQGLEMRKKVVGEDYVAGALEKGKSDFLRPLQQFATVRLAFIFLPSAFGSFPCCQVVSSLGA